MSTHSIWNVAPSRVVSETGPLSTDANYIGQEESVQGSKKLIETVLNLVHEKARGKVREEWSRHALSAACSLPRARADRAGSRLASASSMGLVAGSAAAGASAGIPNGSAADEGGGEIAVDGQWMARRKRSHRIYRALGAPVGVPDVIELLRSLAQSKGCSFRVGDHEAQVRVSGQGCAASYHDGRARQEQLVTLQPYLVQSIAQACMVL